MRPLPIRFLPAGCTFSVALVASGCGLNLTTQGISYNVPPQEFKQSVGTATGNLPTVPCSSVADTCAAVAGSLPTGATASCDTTRGQCVATYDLHVAQTINLSQQQGFPATVLASPVVQNVEVTAISYWAAANSLTLTTPAITIYVGPTTSQRPTDPGVQALGTLQPIPAMTLTACQTGTPGTAQSACQMALTPTGEAALGTFAKSYSTPFNLIFDAPIIVHGGDPMPSGAIDLFLQPTLTFVL